jgi:YhcN/YlaJ family sporulation lipoprotein
MKTNLRAGIVAGICLSVAMLGGCTQQGTAPGQTGYSTTQNLAYNRNNLMNATTQYSLNNILGTNPGYRNNTGYNNMTGTNPGYGNNLTNYMTGTGYNPNVPSTNKAGYGTTGTNNLTRAGTNLTGTIPNATGKNLTGYNTAQQTPNRQKADAIRRQVLAMKGVRNCDATVIGKTALVGIKTAPGTNNTALKQRISSMVRKTDGTITNCAVKDSSNIISRIRKLNASVQKNSPISAITTEFDRLVRGR